MNAPTQRLSRAFRPEVRDDGLGGIVGQVAGFAVVYDQMDNHGTMFGRGSLERTMRERVAAGKVKLFWDHGDAPTTGWYDSDLHIGTVRSLEDRPLPDGRWGAWMVADIFDTPKGREAHTYLKAVLATGGETGLSVGGRPQGIKHETIKVGGQSVERFTEFPLQEISITSMQSVPDSEVMAVRADEMTVAEAPSDEVTPAATADVMTEAAPEPIAGSEPVESTTGWDRLLTAVTPTRAIQEAAYEALTRSLDAAFCRALVRAVHGDATTEDNDAAAPVAADSDATAEDSPTTPEAETPPPVVHATMEARLAALRQSFA